MEKLFIELIGGDVKTVDVLEAHERDLAHLEQEVLQALLTVRRESKNTIIELGSGAVAIHLGIKKSAVEEAYAGLIQKGYMVNDGEVAYVYYLPKI